MLFDKFASGGMATVHLGRLDGAGGFSRVVAIKRLLPHLVQSGEFSEMLLNEARLAARVRHPNVVPTLDVVASKGEVLLVLEYVHGESLSALCRTQAKQRGVVPIGVAVSIVLGLLQGLHAVHEATDERGRSLGLVHRDVSPQNVMVGVDGMARVLDFGIVKALEQIEETVPNRLKGKTGYMSPEQIRGERVTRSSDIFAAGIVLWEMLTLRRFSSASTDRERLEKIMSGNYARPGSHRLDLSSALDEIVMRALSFDAKDRYATAREFADALSRSGEGVSSSQVADWVQRLAEKTLLERARLLAQVENWDDGSPEIELNSTPFAVEKDDLDVSDTTGEHSPRPPGVRGSRASRPTPVPAAVSADHAPAEPGATNALATPAAHGATAGVSGSLQPLFEHPRLKPLFQHLPDPRARVGVVAGALFLLLFLLYLLIR
jgi:eukaryotic-like serine/threonine-protein kinase